MRIKYLGDENIDRKKLKELTGNSGTVFDNFYTKNNIYEVFGIIFFRNHIRYFSIEDDNFIGSSISIIFEVVDNKIPDDWIFTEIKNELCEDVIAVQGIECFAKNEKSLVAMLDLEKEKVQEFWEYYRTKYPVEEPEDPNLYRC